MGEQKLLRELGPSAWAAVGPDRAYGLPLGERMTAIRLASGELLVIGPIACTAPLRAELEALGPVRHLCVFNRRSGRHLQAWQKAYPEAQSYGPLGLAEDEPALALRGLPSAGAALGEPGELALELFGGMPMLDELVFHHPPSRSVLLADLGWHLPSEGPLWARALLRLSLSGLRFGPPREVRLMVTDRQAAQQSLERVLGWDFDRIVVRRGPVLERGGKRALRRAYDWLEGAYPWWR